jgi:hypothetical protein
VRRGVLLGLAFASVVLPGCMQRTIHISSEPSGAQVYLNDVEVGRTPVEVGFTYFGTYDVRLRKDGFEPLVTSAKTDAPMHEWPGFDLIAMAWPQGTETNIRWHFLLEPSDLDEDALLERARGFRQDFSGDSPEGGGQ